MGNWKSFSELHEMQRNISDLGYRMEYVEEHGLIKSRKFHGQRPVERIMYFFEPLEVRLKGEEIIWRENENRVHKDIPSAFETQFGKFVNHNHGEFPSWLSICNNDESLEEKGLRDSSADKDYFVQGNFCDMFDCGNYCFAISNLLHGGIGVLKVLRIDKDLNIATLYDNMPGGIRNRFEYAGRFRKENGWYFVISGHDIEKDVDRRVFKDKTILFSAEEDGALRIHNEWKFGISSTNSIAALGDFVYFGQNKMITRLNLASGEHSYFTNKSEDEIAALVDSN